MSSRKQYENALRDYPDLVSVKDLLIILGGITRKTALEFELLPVKWTVK